MMPADFIGRYCWLASAIGGAWRWQSPKQRETAAETLACCFVANAKNRAALPPADAEILEVMVELGEVICQTLSKAANRRIVRKINEVRAIIHGQNEMPF